MYVKFEDLQGKVLEEIENKGDAELVFTTATGDVYKLYHERDCCESVYIESICGDLDDLIGEPLLEVEEVVQGSHVDPEGRLLPDLSDESFTWTFYKLGTRKGRVTIRWYGESNGYYSESVDFCLVSQS